MQFCNKLMRCEALCAAYTASSCSARRLIALESSGQARASSFLAREMSTPCPALALPQIYPRPCCSLGVLLSVALNLILPEDGAAAGGADDASTSSDGKPRRDELDVTNHDSTVHTLKATSMDVDSSQKGPPPSAAPMV